MRQRTASALVLLILLSSISAAASSSDPVRADDSSITDADARENSRSVVHLEPGSPWVDSSLWERVESGAEQVRVTVITRSLAVL